MDEQTLISDVSDTSIWVAYYRAKESERENPLFHDVLAKKLIGEKGRQIDQSMGVMGKYTEWSVVMRTVLIDDFIRDLIKQGVDTVVNLGAGLDTRPYRMALPESLHWIEVDYPKVIERKNQILKDEKPRCRLTRVELDLADDQKRRDFLKQVASSSQNILVITEGVIPYLTPEQVMHLADDLHSQSGIHYWITEYFDPRVYKHLKARIRTQKMRNAPFRFYPPDWFGFFEQLGWVKKDLRYIGEETVRRGRSVPMPWWAKVLIPLMPKAAKENSLRMTGYMVFQKKEKFRS